MSLDTRFGRFGFHEYDWNRPHMSPESGRATLESFREQVRERFILQKIQPRTSHTTIIFVGHYVYRVDCSLLSLLVLGLGASCLLALITSEERT